MKREEDPKYLWEKKRGEIWPAIAIFAINNQVEHDVLCDHFYKTMNKLTFTAEMKKQYRKSSIREIQEMYDIFKWEQLQLVPKKKPVQNPTDKTAPDYKKRGVVPRGRIKHDPIKVCLPNIERSIWDDVRSYGQMTGMTFSDITEKALDEFFERNQVTKC